MSELDKLDEVIRSFSDLAAVSSLTSASAFAIAQRMEAMAVQLRREELFSALATLSGEEFAKAVQEKTGAAKNGYDTAIEFYIQERVCMLLAYGVMSQDEILSKMDDGSFNCLLLALSAIGCMPPALPKDIYDDFLDDRQRALDNMALRACVAPFRSADWRHLSEGRVQECVQFECEPTSESDKETER